MPENLLALLKLCLLALLYLFFLRVIWAVWSEVRSTKPEPVGGTPKLSRAESRPPNRVIVTDPEEMKGLTFDIGRELTIGRGGGCHISLPDDTFVSQLHARVYLQDNQPWVEDLGSTNGSYLNGRRIATPSPIRKGDSVQIGSTVMEVM